MFLQFLPQRDCDFIFNRLSLFSSQIDLWFSIILSRGFLGIYLPTPRQHMKNIGCTENPKYAWYSIQNPRPNCLRHQPTWPWLFGPPSTHSFFKYARWMNYWVVIKDYWNQNIRCSIQTHCTYVHPYAQMTYQLMAAASKKRWSWSCSHAHAASAYHSGEHDELASLISAWKSSWFGPLSNELARLVPHWERKERKRGLFNELS